MSAPRLACAGGMSPPPYSANLPDRSHDVGARTVFYLLSFRPTRRNLGASATDKRAGANELMFSIHRAGHVVDRAIQLDFSAALEMTGMRSRPIFILAAIFSHFVISRISYFVIST